MTGEGERCARVVELSVEAGVEFAAPPWNRGGGAVRERACR
jgi:hypothetical protein